MRRFAKIFILVVVLVGLASAGSVLGQYPEPSVDINIRAWVGDPPPPPPPGVTPGASARITFFGYAYPDSLITIKKDGAIAAIFYSFSNGRFEREITGLEGGTYTFSLSAEDSDGNKSMSTSFNVTLLAGSVATAGNIFLSPTIALDKTAVKLGDVILVSGQSFPGATIHIFLEPTEEKGDTIVDPSGRWQYALSTAGFEIREYEIRVYGATDTGLNSPISETLTFSVLEADFLRADVNGDNKVDLVDLSILASWYKKPLSALMIEIEKKHFNGDGVIDLVDLSIAAYHWTG
jgi:hypothetical protein